MTYKTQYNFTFRSPDMLAPARMPVAAGKNMENTEKKLFPSVNAGLRFSINTSAAAKKGNCYTGARSCICLVTRFLTMVPVMMMI